MITLFKKLCNKVYKRYHRYPWFIPYFDSKVSDEIFYVPWYRQSHVIWYRYLWSLAKFRISYAIILPIRVLCTHSFTRFIYNYLFMEVFFSKYYRINHVKHFNIYLKDRTKVEK